MQTLQERHRSGWITGLCVLPSTMTMPRRVHTKRKGLEIDFFERIADVDAGSLQDNPLASETTQAHPGYSRHG
jgi:hypothetical protein